MRVERGRGWVGWGSGVIWKGDALAGSYACNHAMAS